LRDLFLPSSLCLPQTNTTTTTTPRRFFPSFCLYNRYVHEMGLVEAVRSGSRQPLSESCAEAWAVLTGKNAEAADCEPLLREISVGTLTVLASVAVGGVGAVVCSVWAFIYLGHYLYWIMLCFVVSSCALLRISNASCVRHFSLAGCLWHPCCMTLLIRD
jgi:hypothetical protein